MTDPQLSVLSLAPSRVLRSSTSRIDHRARAEVENVIKGLKHGIKFNHMLSGRFGQRGCASPPRLPTASLLQLACRFTSNQVA